ncbi:hypothetical protein DFH09DRAFT_1067407 [Mycena vulgaris]|nr:hypothetical protein DFH09DRAFT_1067407 [Mycena vulgaris]
MNSGKIRNDPEYRRVSEDESKITWKKTRWEEFCKGSKKYRGVKSAETKSRGPECNRNRGQTGTEMGWRFLEGEGRCRKNGGSAGGAEVGFSEELGRLGQDFETELKVVVTEYPEMG